MSWQNFYVVLVKNGGDYSKASAKDLVRAEEMSDDPETDKQIALEKYKHENGNE